MQNSEQAVVVHITTEDVQGVIDAKGWDITLEEGDVDYIASEMSDNDGFMFAYWLAIEAILEHRYLDQE
jgi:hypothetical protein